MYSIYGNWAYDMDRIAHADIKLKKISPKAHNLVQKKGHKCIIDHYIQNLNIEPPKYSH